MLMYMVVMLCVLMLYRCCVLVMVVVSSLSYDAGICSARSGAGCEVVYGMLVNVSGMLVRVKILVWMLVVLLLMLMMMGGMMRGRRVRRVERRVANGDDVAKL